MSEAQDFCLRWSSYSKQLSEALRSLLDRELLVDVTLACGGRSLRAHRTILSACSSYFQELFLESTHPHTIVILKDVKYEELEALVKFMYHGEVTLNHETLPGFLHTAETLHVRGLSDSTFMPSNMAVDSSKVTNVRNSMDESVLTTQPDENTISSQRLSPVHIKRIKLEPPTVSPFDHSVRGSHHEHFYDSHADNETVREHEVHCSQSSEDLSLINPGQNPATRLPTSFEGLTQLAMPAIQNDPSHIPQFIGIGSNIQSHQSPLLKQQLSHHGNNNMGNVSSAGRPFRQRVLYNQEQLLQLEAWYCQDRYPSGALMHEYAERLASMVPNIPGSIGAQPMRQNVDYWFQNRRRKDFHPEVMQQREKKKLAKSLWGGYNGNAPGNSGNSPSTSHSENNNS